MAEIEGNTAIVPSGVDYAIEVSEFDPAGKKEVLRVPVPRDEKWGTVMLTAAVLKRTTWRTFDIPTIIHAIMYADRMGLDVVAGDVYMAEEGRLSTTAGAKIRHAMGTGKIVGYSVEITEGENVTLEYQIKGQAAKWSGPNLHAKVTVEVAGWKAPVVYSTTLAEWFVGRNPNWRIRPAYMLRRNALSKAFEEVAPMGVEPDEAPPVERPAAETNLVPSLEASLAKARIRSAS